MRTCYLPMHTYIFVSRCVPAIYLCIHTYMKPQGVMTRARASSSMVNSENTAHASPAVMLCITVIMLLITAHASPAVMLLITVIMLFITAHASPAVMLFITVDFLLPWSRPANEGHRAFDANAFYGPWCSQSLSHTHTHTGTRTYTHIHTHTHTHIHTRTCTRTYTHIHTHVHTRTYTHTRSYTTHALRHLGRYQ
jgi:hypothetical protein